MRTPIEKGLASICTPRSWSIVEGVARAVADRQHDMIGLQIVAGVEVQAAHPARSVGPRSRCRCPSTRCSKRYSPPSASIVSRMLSTIVTSRKVPMCGCASVRISGGAPALTNSVSTLRPRIARILDLAVELAVGEGAGAAFAELHVRFGIEHAAAPQAPGVLGAFAHHLAAIEDDRAEAHLRQDQAGEQAAGAGADHHRARAGAVRRRLRDEAIVGVGRRHHMAVVGEPGEQRGFVAHRDVDRIDEQDRGLPARVIGAAGDAVIEQILGRDAQSRDDGGGQGFGRDGRAAV